MRGCRRLMIAQSRTIHSSTSHRLGGATPPAIPLPHPYHTPTTPYPHPYPHPHPHPYPHPRYGWWRCRSSVMRTRCQRGGGVIPRPARSPRSPSRWRSSTPSTAHGSPRTCTTLPTAKEALSARRPVAAPLLTSVGLRPPQWAASRPLMARGHPTGAPRRAGAAPSSPALHQRVPARRVSWARAAAVAAAAARGKQSRAERVHLLPCQRELSAAS